jgi:hypothetical protein
MQLFPAEQSASLAQAELQVVPLQANAPHDWVTAGLHAPLPSQVRGSVAIVPVVGQLGPTHVTPAA